MIDSWQVTGYHPFVRPKYVRRSTTSQESISRKQLAARTAEVVKDFVMASAKLVSRIDNLPHESSSEMPRILKFGPGHIELKDIYLLEVRHASRGSLQPTLAYIPRWH
ncbi:hypothetical protein BC835DRAFT_286023 [Cytidiella melzeri]|nr:hypothetical protein BC835DRAFT_286023 [Cytidiella melzeri]